MEIAQAKNQVSLAIKAKRPILLVGQPGVGKTAIAEQTASELGMDFQSEVATTLEPTDLKGLPAVVEGQAEYLPYGFLRAICNAKHPTLALIDDIGHAGPEVQKALMHLLLARSVGDKKVSDHVGFVLATNDVGQRAGVTGLLSPLQNRLYIIKVTPSTTNWCEWAVKNNIDPSVVAFVKSTPRVFEEWSQPIGIEASCTPRSLHMLSDFIKAGAKTISEYAGCVGNPIATQFATYLEVYQNLPQVSLVITDPDAVSVPDTLDKKHGICAALACVEDPPVWKNIIKYLEKFPKEFQVSCIADTLSRTPELEKCEAIRNWVVANKDLIL